MLPYEKSLNRSLYENTNVLTSGLKIEGNVRTMFRDRYD